MEATNIISDNNPSVSVIIPTFNRAQLLHRALRSVFQQTYTDYEIIIIDDASTDETFEIIQNHYKDKVIYIKHKYRKGGGAARNSGIKVAKGSYLAFLDSDDEWLPNKLEKQINLFKENSLNVGLIYTWFENICNSGDRHCIKRNYKGNLFKKLLIRNIVGSCSLVMLKREVLNKSGNFDENLPARQDLDLWLRICQTSEIDVVPEVLVKIYQQNSYERITSNIENLLLAREIFYKKYENLLHKENLSYLYLCNLGQFYREYYTNKKKLRKYYLTAIKLRPYSIRPHLLFFSTLFPHLLYKNLRLLYKNLFGKLY